VQQQHEEVTELFDIPRKFKPGYRLLLQASEADFRAWGGPSDQVPPLPRNKARGLRRVQAALQDHGDPLEIHFCDHCGDFFARRDSLEWHRNLAPAECHKVTPVKAAEKRRVTEEAHEDFIQRLEHGLMMGGHIRRPFSPIIKERYPEKEADWR